MYINPTPALWLDSFFYKHSFLIDIGTIIFIFLSFILSFSCFIKTFDKLHKQHEKGAYFWLLLAIGTVPFISAWTISAYYQLFLGITISFPSSLDTLPLYTYFIWLCSLLYLLTKEANKRELIRFLFDILIFILIITGFMWEIFFSELVFKLSGNMFADLIILAYPVVNFATLYIVFLLYYSTRSSKKRYIYTMIAISFGFQTFADFVYIYNSVWGTSIYGKWIDPFWSISLLLKGSAGILLLYFKNSQQITTQISAKTRHYDFTAYGLLLVFIIYIILRNLANISLLEYIFFIIFFLIMIKYFIILFRKEKAFEKLHNLSKNLEKTVEDKTKELKLALEQMNKMALTDHLTGLPNRYLLYQKLEEFILEANQKKEQFAVMFLDLDGFKFVNDTAGHNAGDILLIEVANRLKKWVREQDVVARLGGDEFTILLKFTEKEQITKIAKRIINDFSKQFFIKGKEFHISTSIGISLFPLDGESPIELIKKADKAMYFAKQHGKNNFRFFYSVYERINHKINIKNKLGSALENNELAIHYQPQYDLKTNKILGFEALLRWENSQLGKIPPDDFIPIAEETGVIIPIGKWLIKTACSQIKKLETKYKENFSIAINVSPIQFTNSFLQDIKQIIEETRMNPKALYLEITESQMLNIDKSKEILTGLKQLGIKIAIDDFGKGFSSLGTIASLSIDKIKIDQFFIKDMTNNQKTRKLVKTIIEMGKNLNTVVVAEGVETKEQVLLLKNLNCDIAQGYYYSPPIPIEGTEKILE